MSAYLAQPPASTFLLLTASVEAADGLSAAMKRNAAAAARKIKALKHPFATIIANHSWVEFPAMREAQMRTWVHERARANSYAIDDAAVDLLIMRAGSSLRDVSLELDKLETYVGDRTAITSNDVLDVVGSGKSYSVFELQKAIGRCDARAAFRIVSKIMELGRQEMLIMAMLTRYMVALLRLIDARRNSTDRSEIARLTGIPMFALDDHLGALDALGAARVERSMHSLAWADTTLKSTSTDPIIVLHSLLARLLD